MDSNRRMRSSNVQGFANKVLTLYEKEMRRRRIRKRLRSAVKLYVHRQFNFYIVFLCNGIHNIPLLSAVTEKRVSVPEAHKTIFIIIHMAIVVCLEGNFTSHQKEPPTYTSKLIGKNFI